LKLRVANFSYCLYSVSIPKLHQTTLLQLLCTLVQPIGDHRRSNTLAKKSSKRKRKHSEKEDSSHVEHAEESQAVSRGRKPAEFTQFHWVLVGVNSITRQLEIEISPNQDKGASPKLVAVFILGSRDSIIHSHLPVMCALASRSRSAGHAIRVVYLDADAHRQLGQALALPRVGVIGILSEEEPDCSTALKDLISFSRDHLSPAKCSILDQSVKGLYQPLKIT